ncbi:hypothetical protein [Clostridium sp. LIBA-8841]|uniref:hypothetical protein n=1 Tax=Clostridium sp. LIBA-8841 TaxID=2987530 RepID=UPI002AC577F2|nr:hypothetical protein [Clostridium sp. LIBA-8841]MDZ5252781.1 hypothetical protein [Clostridium sp. LIBA-8841]
MRIIYIKKYKRFLPVEYVEPYNKSVKKRINIYILFLLLFNLVFYAEIIKENNRIEKYLNENKSIKVEKSLGEEFINRINSLKKLLENEEVLKFNLERNEFTIEIHNDYKEIVLREIKEINGIVEEINLNEVDNINTIKGVLK